MPLTLHVMLATPELHNVNLVAATVANHLGVDRTTLNHGRTYLAVIAINQHEHLVKSHFITSLGLEAFHANLVAFGHPLLLATCFKYCLHGKSRLK